MKTIWKYTLEIINEQIIDMPKGARILPRSLTLQHQEPVFWALVETDNNMERRVFNILLTGKPANEAYEKDTYIGTFQIGPLVYHVFEKNYKSKI